MAEVVIKGIEQLGVIFLRLHIIIHDILKVLARQVNDTLFTLRPPAHQFVEVVLDALPLFHFLLNHFL